MPKQHELLPVEKSLNNQADKCRTELMTTFEKKRHLFEEKRTTYRPNAENEETTVEHQSDLQSTVRKEISWLSKFMVKALDASYQISKTNCIAKGDIYVDGELLLKDVPATTLLDLEKRLAEVQSFISAIPTLDPAKGFVEDPQRGEGIYRAREVVKNRTKKDVKVVVRYEATKEHPAQADLVPVENVVGKIYEQEWSGLISPAQKADMLDRVETLSRSVKQARARANEAPVDTSDRIGEVIFKHIFG